VAHSLAHRSFILTALATYAVVAVQCTTEDIPPEDSAGGSHSAGKGGTLGSGGQSSGGSTAAGSGGSAGSAASGGSAGSAAGGAAGSGAECTTDSDCGVGQVCSTFGSCALAPCDPPAIEFSMTVEGASSVSVAGSFNAWDPALSPLSDDDGDGVWTGTVDIAPGAHQYKFVIDETDWVKDPSNPDTGDDGFGGENSLITIGCEGALPPLSGFGGAGGGGGAGGEGGAGGRGGAPAEAGAGGTDATAGAAGAAGAGGGGEPCQPDDSEFSLVDEDATSVAVAGSFNGWSSSAWALSDADEDGTWTGSFPVASGVYQYKFVIDGTEWITDPGNPETADDGYGGLNSELTVSCE
jgi:hypothetical protein